VVQLAAHGAQAGFDVAQALAVGQLRKGHGQILVAARKASMARISAIALNALLELAGGEVIQELGEDGLSGIHPSLSAIGAIEGQSRPALDPAAFNFKSKNKSYKLSRLLCQGYSERSDFSRTLLRQSMLLLSHCQRARVVRELMNANANLPRFGFVTKPAIWPKGEIQSSLRSGK
jgi:hypothetical protein